MTTNAMYLILRDPIWEICKTLDAMELRTAPPPEGGPVVALPDRYDHLSDALGYLYSALDCIWESESKET